MDAPNSSIINLDEPLCQSLVHGQLASLGIFVLFRRGIERCHMGLDRAPKGHESKAQGLPWVCCFIAVRPVRAPESDRVGQ